MISLYIARLPDGAPSEPLSCLQRQAEIDSVSNERVKREKYYVWRLLEYAIKNSLGVDASRLNFAKCENGKWTCEQVEFSLSHSGELLAVAVSQNKVGVDVERIRVKRREGMVEYCLTESEKESYILAIDKDEYLIRKWCEKEAIFKLKNENGFRPSNINTAKFFCDTRPVEASIEKYIVSVAAENSDTVEMFDEIEV